MNQSKNIYTAVGIGEVLFDIFPSCKKLGGAPVNFAYHLNSLGINCYPVSAVGKDKTGMELTKTIQSNSLSTEYIQINSGYPTGTVQVELDDQGIPNYVIHENVAWDNIEMNDELLNLAWNCNVVCFGTLAQRSDLSKQTIRNFIENSSDNCIKVFDINLRQHYYSDEIINNSLRLASVLKLNNDELSEVASLFGYAGSSESILSKLMSNFGLKLIAVTQGSEGSILVSSEKVSSMKPETISVLDTVGAGDAFTAGLVFGLLMNFDIDKTNRFANQLASYVCSKTGANPTLEAGLLDKFK
ncbi:MAG: carbohydrate kinase [Ignavibacterium sp.]|nr:MAG: carbohydrate kinase [Ignavibacterium sp.]